MSATLNMNFRMPSLLEMIAESEMKMERDRCLGWEMRLQGQGGEGKRGVGQRGAGKQHAAQGEGRQAGSATERGPPCVHNQPSGGSTVAEAEQSQVWLLAPLLLMH